MLRRVFPALSNESPISFGVCGVGLGSSLCSLGEIGGLRGFFFLSLAALVYISLPTPLSFPLSFLIVVVFLLS